MQNVGQMEKKIFPQLVYIYGLNKQSVDHSSKSSHKLKILTVMGGDFVENRWLSMSSKLWCRSKVVMLFNIHNLHQFINFQFQLQKKAVTVYEHRFFIMIDITSYSLHSGTTFTAVSPTPTLRCAADQWENYPVDKKSGNRMMNEQLTTFVQNRSDRTCNYSVLSKLPFRIQVIRLRLINR